MLSKQEVQKLSNDELKLQLKSAKISCGPITTTTRRIYEGRLNAHFEIQRKNKEATAVTASDNTLNDSNKDINPEASKENQPNNEQDCTKNFQVKENNNKNTRSINDVETSKKDDLIITASIDENHFAVGNQQSSSLNSNSFDTKNEPEIKVVNDNNQTSTTATEGEEKQEIGDGFFYGVWIPLSPSRIKLKNKPKVFFSKKSALNAVRKYPGSRFKQFKTKEEAEKFSLTPPNIVTVDKVIAMVAKNNDKESLTIPKIEALKVPTVQEVQKFRKFIEDGDMYNFQKCINNPKYLINSKDFPVVVHEGMRSNALHAAIKSDRLNMCQFIMDRVTSIETYIDLYPDTPVKDLEFRKEHIEKLFLNTPEKIVSIFVIVSNMLNQYFVVKYWIWLYFNCIRKEIFKIF